MEWEGMAPRAKISGLGPAPPFALYFELELEVRSLSSGGPGPSPQVNEKES